MSEEEEKLKITLEDNGEIRIAGNRAGLRFLARICNGLADMSDEEAKTGIGHWHLDEFMNTAEEGSVPTTLLYDPNL